MRFFLSFSFIKTNKFNKRYPLSATIISECSEEETRGRNMAIAFASQGIGNVMAPLIYMIILEAGTSLYFSWRISFIFPVLPLLITLPFRIALAREEKIQKEIEEKKIGYNNHAFSWHTLSKNIFTLIGTSGTWLIFDICKHFFYFSLSFFVYCFLQLFMGMLYFREQ
jgi:MFS family permease